jgi:hypothetical protein
MITTPSDMARNIRTKKRKLTSQLDPVSPHGPDSQHFHHTQENIPRHEHGHASASEGFTGDPTSLVQDQQTGSPVSKKARSTPPSSSSVHHQETYPQDQNTTHQDQNISFQDSQDTFTNTAAQTRRTDALTRPAGGGFASSPLNLFRGPSRTQIMRHVASLNNMWRRSSPSCPVDSDCVAPPEDVDIIQEFDHEVSVAVTRIGCSLLGLNAHPDQQLMESPGVRKLVARNLAWFHGSSDFFKLCGLILAKKINRVIENQIPSNALLSPSLPPLPASLAYPPPPRQAQAQAQEEENHNMLIATESLGPLSSATSSSVLLLGSAVHRPQG